MSQKQDNKLSIIAILRMYNIHLKDSAGDIFRSVTTTNSDIYS